MSYDATRPSRFRYGVRERETARRDLSSGEPLRSMRDSAFRARLARRDLAEKAAVASVPDFVLAATRLGYGPTPAFKSEFQSLGANPQERLANYIDQQLHPGTIDDSAFDARLAAAGLGTLNKSHEDLWHDHVGESTSVRNLPMVQLEQATFMRAVYSKKQLREVLVNFWHDHFNVYGWDYWIAPVMPSYDKLIRQNVFGNFRLLLEGIAKHSAMLYFLDNYTSEKGEPNENWARELFELHTLGAENYVGTGLQGAVPLDGNGVPIGYVDRDVFEAARCFTGWTVNNGYHGPYDNGSFYFNSESHDNDTKTVLNADHSILNDIQPDDQTISEGRIVLNRLCSHPGTARHIARKLCKRLVGDNPSEALVQQAADVFHDQWNPWEGGGPSNRGQLLNVYQTILESDEFKNTWGEKTRRPFEVVVGTMRAINVDFDFLYSNDEYDDFLWRYDQTGHPIYSWHTPDGFPEERASWESTGPRVFTWRVINWMSDEPDSGAPYFNARSQTPGDVDTPTLLVDYWVDRMLRRDISADDRDALIDYMRATGGGPHDQLDLNNDDTYDRLRGLLALIANSPYFAEK